MTGLLVFLWETSSGIQIVYMPLPIGARIGTGWLS